MYRVRLSTVLSLATACGAASVVASGRGALLLRLLQLVFGGLSAYMWVITLAGKTTFILCDFVDWLARRLTIITAGWEWLVACACGWAVVLIAQTPFLTKLLAKQPVLITSAQAYIAELLYRLTLRGVLGRPRYQALLSSRMHAELEARASHGPLRQFCLCAVILSTYVVTHLDEISRMHRVATTLYAALLISPKVMRLLNGALCSASSSLAKHPLLTAGPWRVSYAPVCRGGTVGVEEHDVCSICLESLCESVEASAFEPLLVANRSRARISLVRPLRRTRAAIAGIASARRLFPLLAGSGSSSSRRRLVTLRCNHTFHAECIDAVGRNAKEQGLIMKCPTCRVRWHEEPEFPEQEQSILFGIGLSCVTALYTMTYCCRALFVPQSPSSSLA